MFKLFVRRATVPLTVGCLWLSLGRPCFGTLIQQQPSTTKDKKANDKGKGSGKDSAGAKPVEKSKDADGLSNERMSTRGLHKGGNDQGAKPEGQAQSKDQQSTSKPDTQK